MEKVENPVFRPNKLVAILFYLFMTLLGSGLLIILIAVIYCMTHQLNFQELMELMASTEFEKDIVNYSAEIQLAYYKVNALGNMFGYLLMLFVIAFYMRNYLIEDTIAVKKKYRFFLWFLPVAAVVFYGLSLLVDFIIGNFVGVSENQMAIDGMISNGGAFAMFIAVVICAPIVEELIYRKAIFCLFEKQHIVIPYIVSILFFSLPHMLTTDFSDPGRWFLIAIPYLVCALLLALTYHLSHKNIYASWFVHMINNLVGFILIFVG